MKLSDNFSFLFGRGIKVKVVFLIIVVISLFIVILDTFSIFSLLSIVSFLTDAGDLQEKFSHLKYLPQPFLELIKNLNFKTILLFLIIILFTRNLVNILYQYIIYRYIKYLELDTQKKLFFILMKKKYLDFYNQTSNKLIKNLTVSVNQYLVYVEIIAKVISDFIILVLYFILLAYLSFFETIFIFGYFFIIFFSLKKILSNFSYKFGVKYNIGISNLNLVILNTFKNFSQIILRDLKKKQLELFSSVVHKNSFARLIISLTRSVNRQFIEISVLILILIIFYTLDNIYSFKDILALTTVYITAAYRIMPTITNLVTSFIKLKNFQYGFKIINDQLNIFNTKYKKIKFLKSNQKKLYFKKNLSLKNISFKYQKSNEFLFKNMNFEIKKNQMIGIIGSSGTGKTTLLKILLGLIDPSSGKILLDNKLIKNNEIDNYQSLLSYLPQENLFIPGSIKENIAFGEENIDKKRIIYSLKQANCYDFVKKLKNNLNHKLKENGKNFSIGQLQRFALARAIYFDTEILILDEPTSALDKGSEEKFLKLIRGLKGKKTIIIVSHKSTTLKNCDLTYKVSKQKLIKA